MLILICVSLNGLSRVPDIISRAKRNLPLGVARSLFLCFPFLLGCLYVGPFFNISVGTERDTELIMDEKGMLTRSVSVS